MAEAYIVATARTAGGRKGGRLKGWHPVDLAAQVIDALVDRAGCDPALVEDVIMGCVGQVGEQGINVARNAVMASKLPESVPGTSVDRQCGSSQQALHFAAQAVMSGAMDVVIAAGVESMTRVPMGLSAALPMQNGFGFYMSPELQKKYPDVQFSQFTGAEMVAKKYGLAKDEPGRVRLQLPQEGHRRHPSRRLQDRDRAGGPSPLRTAPSRCTRWTKASASTPRLDAIKGVKLLAEGGALTAASSSQICDGASGVMVVNEAGLKALGRQAARPYPPHDGDRRRSGHHAGSPAAGHPPGPEEGRHEDRRDRPL